MLFSLQFHEASTMVGLKMCQCINVRFVGTVHSPTAEHWQTYLL